MAIDTEPLSEVGYIIISAALPSGGIAPLELMTSTPWIEAWNYLDFVQPIGTGVTMPNDFSTAAIEAASAPARAPMLTFPEPLASLLKGRSRHPLGNQFGVTHFGVNMTYLPPGSISAPRHSHSHQDEFIYILEGTPVLVTDADETPLRPGMCAGFKAGSGNAHHLRNRSDTTVVYLEVGASNHSQCFAPNRNSIGSS